MTFAPHSEAAVRANTHHTSVHPASNEGYSPLVTEHIACADTADTRVRMITHASAPAKMERQRSQWSQDAQHAARSTTRKAYAEPVRDNWIRRANTARRLKNFAGCLSKSTALNLFDCSKLFRDLTASQSALLELRREDSPRLHSFTKTMVDLLKRFASHLEAAEQLPTWISTDHERAHASAFLFNLDAEGIRTFCNGLATLYGNDARDCLFSRDQLNQLTAALGKIHDALMVQAMNDGLPAELPSSDCLLDILNAQSRGLKIGVLHSDRLVIRELATRALEIMEGWISVADGRSTTEIGKLVSRQLRKILAQLGTIATHELLPLDASSDEGCANRARIRALANKLCFMSVTRETMDVPDKMQSAEGSDDDGFKISEVIESLVSATAPVLVNRGKEHADLPQATGKPAKTPEETSAPTTIKASLTPPASTSALLSPDNTSVQPQPPGLSSFFRSIVDQIRQDGSSNVMVAHAVNGKLDALGNLLTSTEGGRLLLSQDSKLHVNPLGAAIMAGQSAVIDRILSTPAGRQSAAAVYGPANALIIAALGSNSHAMAALLNNIESPEMLALQPGPRGQTPLMIAASNGDTATMRQLLALSNAEAQAVQVSSMAGGCALGFAISAFSSEGIQLLLDLPNASSQMMIATLSGANAIATAIASNNPAALALLLAKPGASTALCAPAIRATNTLSLALAMKTEPCVQLILKSPYLAQLSVSVTPGSESPLLVAIELGHAGAWETLLALETAATQAAHVGSSGKNALIAATERRLPDLIKRLLALPNAAQQATFRMNRRQTVQQGGDHKLTSPPGSRSATRAPTRSNLQEHRVNAYQIAKEMGAEDIATMLRRFEPST